MFVFMIIITTDVVIVFLVRTRSAGGTSFREACVLVRDVDVHRAQHIVKKTLFILLLLK